MKMRNTTTALLIALLFITAGCKKWLDVSPKTQIRERTFFETEQGFKEALTGVYIYLGGSSAYGQNLTMGFVDALAQRYNTAATAHIFYRASRYEYNDASTKGYIANTWGAMYTAIGNLNNILTQVDAMELKFTDNNFNLVKGEALALRALIEFDLLRLFGVSPVVDGNRKAIPYPKGFDKSIYPLLTVNQTLDSCMKDLTNAEQLLSVDKTIRGSFPSNPFISYTRNRMNYWAVKGLQARMWLYRGDKPKALAAALEVINNGTTSFPFVTAGGAAQTSNRDRLYANEHLFAISAAKIVDYVDAYFKTSAVNGTPILFTATANTTALYETASGGSSDYRFNYQFVQYSGGYSTSKYWQDDISQAVTTDYLRTLIPVIRLSEIYYIAAECSPSTVDGAGYLNTIRTNRGLAALPTSMNATTLEAEILKEYKKETYGEGQLFYYFKRKNTSLIDGSTIPMTDATWVLPLPESEVEFGKRF